MSQRVVQYQAVIQMAQANPGIYDQVELNRQMLVTLGIKNVEKLIPASADQSPKDPIAENQSLITGRPVKAYAYQEHSAHIQAHTSMMQDPHIQQLIGQSPTAQTMVAAINAHVAEHVAFEYRNQVEMMLGNPLPQGDEKMTPETEKQLSVLMAQAGAQLLKQHQAEAAAAAAQQAAQDPIVQQQNQQLANDKEKNQIAKYKVDKDYDIELRKLGQGQPDPAAQAQQAAQEQQAAAAEQQRAAEVHQQELAQGQQAHVLGLHQQAQKLGHADNAHQLKLTHAQELHEQKKQQAEEQRQIAAAVNAARPHMKEKE
jgi:hypothetical protein